MKNMKKGWHMPRPSRAAKSIVALIVIVSLVAIPLPQSIASWQARAEAAPPMQTPSGQLTRRGIVGEVLEVNTSSIDPNATSDSIMIVQTNWGNVEVIVTNDTEIRSPLQERLSLEDTVGSKVAVLADKSPDSSDDTDTTLRTVTALKVMVVPGKAVRTHARAVVKSKIRDRLQLVDDSGNEIEIEDQDNGTSTNGENQLEEGEEVVLVTQVIDNEAEPDDANGNGVNKVRKAKLVVRGIRSTIHISDRLERITDTLLEESDSPRLQRLKDRIVTFQDRQQERLDKVEERLGELDTPEKKERKARLNNLVDKIDDAVDTALQTDDQGDDNERPIQRVQNIRTKIKERVQEARSDVRETVKDARSDVREQVKDARTDVRETIKDARSDVREQVKDARTDVRETIKDARSDVREQVKDARTDVREQVKEELQERLDSATETDESSEEGRDVPPGRTRRIIGQIVDAATNEDVAEASDAPADDETANRNQQIKNRIQNEVKRELQRRQNAVECESQDTNAAGEATNETECPADDGPQGDDVERNNTAITTRP